MAVWVGARGLLGHPANQQQNFLKSALNRKDQSTLFFIASHVLFCGNLLDPDPHRELVPGFCCRVAIESATALALFDQTLLATVLLEISCKE